MVRLGGRRGNSKESRSNPLRVDPLLVVKDDGNGEDDSEMNSS